MTVTARMIGALALGAAFGAATSLSNALSSWLGLVDGVRLESGWAWPARVVSLTLDSGWAWAAVAVAAGWLAGSRARGAAAGVLALLAATTAYFALDSVFLEEPFTMGSAAVRYWLVASVLCGSVLGVVGACVNRPGLVGLLAGLTVPVGAAVQMIIRPPGSDPMSLTGADGWARLIVWAAAAVGAAVVIDRYRATTRPPAQEHARASPH